MKKLIEDVSRLVDGEIEIVMEDNEDYGDMPSDESHDSFGKFGLTGYCEPEDAIWRRELSDNYYTGLMLGIRNTLKVLKDNPDLLQTLQSTQENK